MVRDFYDNYIRKNKSKHRIFGLISNQKKRVISLSLLFLKIINSV